MKVCTCPHCGKHRAEILSISTDGLVLRCAYCNTEYIQPYEG
jgi:hypothetical protein